MKKIFFSGFLVGTILIINSFIGYAVPLTVSTNIFVQVGKEKLTDFISPLQDPCINSGNKCHVQNWIWVDQSIITNYGSGHLINVTIGQIDESDNAPDYDYYRSWNPQTAGYIMPEGTSIRITDCSIPELIGLSWDISGHQTDSQGILHEYISF
jgi:hypothetical protein